MDRIADYYEILINEQQNIWRGKRDRDLGSLKLLFLRVRLRAKTFRK